MKAVPRTSIIRKLVGSSWGTNINTPRTFSSAFNILPVNMHALYETQSAHVKEVNIALTETYMLIINCEITSKVKKKTKVARHFRHSLHKIWTDWVTIKIKTSFFTMVEEIICTLESERLRIWNERPGKEERTRQIKSVWIIYTGEHWTSNVAKLPIQNTIYVSWKSLTTVFMWWMAYLNVISSAAAFLDSSQAFDRV